jgi:hypothetical protein
MSSSRWLRWLRPAPASVTALALASASCLLRLCLLSLYLPIHFHDSRHFPPIYFPSQHTMIDYFYALRYISTPVKSVYPSCPAMPMAQITLGNTLQNPVNSIGTQVILPSYGSDQPNHLSCHAYGSDQPDQLSYHLWLRSASVLYSQFTRQYLSCHCSVLSTKVSFRSSKMKTPNT